VPDAELPELNDNIVCLIEVIGEYKKVITKVVSGTVEKAGAWSPSRANSVNRRVKKIPHSHEL
jgi:hypothetical protein